MTNQVIPTEAVEAAAKLVADRMGYGWVSEEHREAAREILEASLPFIQAQTLRDAVDAFPLETIHAPDSAVVWMMRRAEELRKGAK